MTAIHMILQHKGGAGKTVVSYLLAQYLESRNHSPVCIDADPYNSSLAAYKGLGASIFPLKDADGQVDDDKISDLIEHLLEKHHTFVVDNGASSFGHICNLLVRGSIEDVLLETNRDLFVHVVITGGTDMGITIAGLDSLAQQLPHPIKIVAWLNEYFGPVSLDGKPFEQLKIYNQLKARIFGIVRIPQYRSYFKKNFETMLLNRMTFSEAIHSKLFRILERQRLVNMERELYSHLDLVFGHMLSISPVEDDSDVVLASV